MSRRPAHHSLLLNIHYHPAEILQIEEIEFKIFFRLWPRLCFILIKAKYMTCRMRCFPGLSRSMTAALKRPPPGRTSWQHLSASTWCWLHGTPCWVFDLSSHNLSAPILRFCSPSMLSLVLLFYCPYMPRKLSRTSVFRNLLPCLQLK